MSDGSRVSALTIFASTSGSSTPARRNGGATNSRRGPSQRTRTSPTPHCCTTRLDLRGFPPAASQAWHEPSVGCPAKGNSPPGVNAHVVVCVQIRRWQEESCLGEIGPARERGHLRFAQSLGGMHHSERIAAQRIRRENIDLRELPTHLRRLTLSVQRRAVCASGAALSYIPFAPSTIVGSAR